MSRKELLVSYVDPHQNLVCFRLTTENTIKSFEKVLEFAQYLKGQYHARLGRSGDIPFWLRSSQWYLISDVRVFPISRSKFRSVPSATSVRHSNNFANLILRYGRSYWERHFMQQRMERGM